MMLKKIHTYLILGSLIIVPATATAQNEPTENTDLSENSQLFIAQELTEVNAGPSREALVKQTIPFTLRTEPQVKNISALRKSQSSSSSTSAMKNIQRSRRKKVLYL